MNNPEMMEIQVSALIDGELARSAMLNVIDTLLEDEQCRRFYRQAREIDLALESTRPRGETRGASTELWDRIEAAARKGGSAAEGTPAAQRFSRHPWWLFRAAAAVLVLAGVVAIGGFMLSPSNGDLQVIDIVANRSTQVMDDERFIELTAEILQADPRYHRAMLDIVEAVSRHSMPREGVVDWDRDFLVNAADNDDFQRRFGDTNLATTTRQVY